MDKDLYRRLRTLSWESLWQEEVRRFNAADARERLDRVAVVRAVGVVFSESGPPASGEEVRAWLRGLLNDPQEKIRRYAANALPKVGAGADDERELITLLDNAGNDREARFAAAALEKIGGEQTLAVAARLRPQTEQKARAAVVRSSQPGRIALDVTIPGGGETVLRLRGRAGLEVFVAEEVRERGIFEVRRVGEGCVEISPRRDVSLSDVLSHRCFGTVSLVLGKARTASTDDLAHVVANPGAVEFFRQLTEGTPRYRIDFVGRGHQRGAVRDLANRIYALCPEILNDARAALWSLDVRGAEVELRPRWSPDPRFAYRLRDVPAASHPPLAACLVRLAGRCAGDLVWDPFCGSGGELIEAALRGGVRGVVGTDLSPQAVEIARGNWQAAHPSAAKADFFCADFRDFGRIPLLARGGVDLVITNPPLGMRVPIPNLRGLIAELFEAAVAVLRPGGRLILTNPIHIEAPHRLLRREFRQAVDMSGFQCRVEKYARLPDPRRR